MLNFATFRTETITLHEKKGDFFATLRKEATALLKGILILKRLLLKVNFI